MGRPLAALLANDGARVFSVDIDSIQVLLTLSQPTSYSYHTSTHRWLTSNPQQEYTKRPPSSSDSDTARRYHPHHVVHSTTLSLQECLAQSDVVVSAVPSASYKVKTEWLKDGCVCVNVAADKNFEADVREKVCGGLLLFCFVSSMGRCS